MLAEGGGQATEEEEKKEEVGRDVLLQSRDPWGKTCRRDMMPTLISFLSKLMILQVLAKKMVKKIVVVVMMMMVVVVVVLLVLLVLVLAVAVAVVVVSTMKMKR